VVLVLCDPGDFAALWAARELETRGVAVEIVTSSVLDSALRWEHRVGGDATSVAIDLFDGRRLSSEPSVGVLNRLSFVPTDRHRRVAGARDAEYAAQEMHALFLSWLHALTGPVVNRPSAQGLAGRYRQPGQWVRLAADAGLRTTPYGKSSGNAPDASPGTRLPAITVFVLEGRVIAPAAVSAELAAGCRALARLAGEALLGIDLVPPPFGTWEFAGATATPYLPLGGEALADALREVLAA